MNFLGQVLGAVFAILVFCLAFTCCKYNRVSNQYEEVRQRERSTSNATIVDRNADKVDPESRPSNRRKNKPDRDTFGKRTASEIQETDSRADTELELGELDVDFA